MSYPLPAEQNRPGDQHSVHRAAPPPCHWRRALSTDLKIRYRSAGEFAGPLFQYSLDSNFTQSSREVQVWLQQLLGLVV